MWKRHLGVIIQTPDTINAVGPKELYASDELRNALS